MAEKLSTGLRDFLNCRGCVRDFLSDSIMKIYSGTPPASANDPVLAAGVLLVTITQASGTTYNRDGWGETVNVTVADATAANVYVFNVTIGSETLVTTRIFTNSTPTIGSTTVVATRLVKLFNEIGCRAASAGTVVYVMAPSRKTLTIALNAGATAGCCTFADGAAQDTAGDLLNFGPSSLGTMSKTSDVWSGLIVASGVAGFFRLVQTGDDGLLSTTQVRAQGAVSTSGAELNMESGTSLTAGQTHTVDNYSFTLPAE